jgi:hypothetical protein
MIIEHSNESLLHISLIKKGAFTLRIINHSLRQQILGYIHEKKRITVTAIHTKFRIEHLAFLRQQNFVFTERDGRFIFYSVNYDRLKRVQQLSEELQKP